ncbi:autotransporter outer membrane beta-barrel domain-containing protein [Candidatus Pelagibacter sp. Uisw_121]|uniref:autotransporter outer membrane beta-barrel domain-containing protein n=1 Tax=Candidatus Pelagibacter sp. Uisw_121 TaxID=3230987 RepID=UPI0039EBA60B
MLNLIKKSKKLILKGALKLKVFLVLFSLFFSSLALAAPLSVTWKGGLIPGGNEQSGLNCTATTNGVALDLDRATAPHDVVLSDDGLQVFTANRSGDGGNNIDNNQLSMNRLGTPNEILTDKIRNDANATCADIEGASPGAISDGQITSSNMIEGLHIGNRGSTFFVLDTIGDIGKFNLSTPYDISTMSYETRVQFGNTIDSMHFSRDGTKLFTLDSLSDNPVVTTYSLPAPFDISSTTQIHQVNLNTKGIVVSASFHDQGFDIEFNPDGSAMFILMANTQTENNNFVYQFSLGKNYDVSTAVNVGKWDMNDVFLNRGSDKDGQPRGMGFSSDGMKLFVVEIKSGTGVDMINQFDLECPYGLAVCVSSASASVASQVELSNQNISSNVSTIFKRFEWIKRNRKNENLSSHNININYPNPLLKSLVSKFEPSLKNNLASLVSNTLNKDEKKKSKWSSWSIVDVSIGDFEETLLDKAKGIKTKGITFGSDRKIGDNKFFGLAVRYADSASNIRRSVQNVDLQSLTLNIYGIVPTINNQYINAVLGLSALKFDNKYSGTTSGNRNGKQAFASINYRTKNAYGKFNITPTGKFTYGVTQLSEFTDFISQAMDRPADDIRYHEDTFVSGEFAGGLLFEMEKYENEQEGTSFQPMGGIEIIYDLSDDITYKYQNVGSTSVNKETITKYYNKKLKTNIGFEHIVENGYTIFVDYQKMISLNDDCGSCAIVGTNRTFINENFIIKISKSKEEDTEFAFDFDPLSNNTANLSYVKDINNFNLQLNSNMNLFTKIPDYGANIEISSKF